MPGAAAKTHAYVSCLSEVEAFSVASSLGASEQIPKGPRTQIIGFLGPQYYKINGIWALKPYYLGP